MEGLLDRFFSFRLALDPGSFKVRACVPGGPIYEVPNVVAFSGPASSGGLNSWPGLHASAWEAIGDDALRAAAGGGRIGLVRPISQGAVAEREAAEFLFARIFARLSGRWWRARPNVLCGIGVNMSTAALHALAESLHTAGASRVRFVPGPVACSVALDRISGGPPAVRLIAELGAERIDLAVASRSGILCGSNLPFGLREFDRSIIGYLGRRGLRLGRSRFHHQAFEPAEAEARAIREELGLPAIDVETIKQATDSATLETPEDVLPRHVGQALAHYVSRIADEARMLLGRLHENGPAQQQDFRVLAEDVTVSSMALAGGGALLGGLVEWLSHELEFEVYTVQEPDTLRIKGLAMLWEDRDLLEEVSLEL